jgi:hypothetical protein
MATLTFLRLGKEIHDDLEDFLADHLKDRQVTGLERLRWRLKTRMHRILVCLVKRVGFGDLI